MSDSPPAKRKCIEPANDPNAREGTFRFKVEKISTMNVNDGRLSKRHIVGGFPWGFNVQRRVAEKGEDSQESLGVFLGCGEINNVYNIWFCDSSITYTLINQEDSTKSVTKTLNRRFDKIEIDKFGFPNFSSWSDITDPSKGFLKDDAVIVEATVRIKSVTGNKFRRKIMYDFFSASEKSDVILVVEDKDFHVSRQLLAIQSSYFNSLFFQKYKEKGQEKIPLHDITAKDFEFFLRIVYRMDMIGNVENLQDILRLADMFDMQNIMDEAENCLMGDTTMTLERKLLFADRNKFEALLEQCLNKLTNREEMMKIKKANEYKLYSAEFKVTLLEMLLGTAGSLYL